MQYEWTTLVARALCGKAGFLLDTEAMTIYANLTLPEYGVVSNRDRSLSGAGADRAYYVKYYNR